MCSTAWTEWRCHAWARPGAPFATLPEVGAGAPGDWPRHSRHGSLVKMEVKAAGETNACNIQTEGWGKCQVRNPSLACCRELTVQPGAGLYRKCCAGKLRVVLPVHLPGPGRPRETAGHLTRTWTRSGIGQSCAGLAAAVTSSSWLSSAADLSFTGRAKAKPRTGQSLHQADGTCWTC